MSSLLHACCCCPTGCECPTDTYLPSSVAATINVTDCCGIARTFTATLTTGAQACPCSVIPCFRYAYNPTPGSCPTLCSNTITSAWKCSDECNDETEALLNNVTLETDPCIARGEGEFGFCEYWALSFNISARNHNYPSAIISTGGGTPCGFDCNYGVGCVVQVNCETHRYWVCKGTLGRTPIGTYTTCAPGALCNDDDIISCLTGVTVTIS